MREKPVFKTTFSRDFTLATVEIWWRAETINHKMWTKEKQPFLPYIVFEKVPGTVNGFYDFRGIEWVKNKLIERAGKDRGFIEYVVRNYSENRLKAKVRYQNKIAVSQKELSQFLDNFETAWVWFEAAWWIWHLAAEEPDRLFVSAEMKAVREKTQDLVPSSESYIKKSLQKFYPELSKFVDVLRTGEIKTSAFPGQKELLERQRGYFFTDNQLLVGASRAEIEQKYSIQLEKIEVDRDVSQFSGETAYKGTVKGKARIVFGLKSLDKVEERDILVSPMTLPDFLPAMKKAAAFITDEGGLLSHAAITAREMRKPCIIGTKIATKVLKDGDLVEVDADEGIVKILKRE